MLENVIIERRFVNRHEIKRLHQQYGIFMCPSRMDTQGVSRDEAMASGLIPLTNSVAAIPEFVDSSSAIIAKEESIESFVEGVCKLYHDENLFNVMSANASQMVRNKSAFTKTIFKEITLITQH